MPPPQAEPCDLTAAASSVARVRVRARAHVVCVSCVRVRCMRVLRAYACAHACVLSMGNTAQLAWHVACNAPRTSQGRRVSFQATVACCMSHATVPCCMSHATWHVSCCLPRRHVECCATRVSWSASQRRGTAATCVCALSQRHSGATKGPRPAGVGHAAALQDVGAAHGRGARPPRRGGGVAL